MVGEDLVYPAKKMSQDFWITSSSSTNFGTYARQVAIGGIPSVAFLKMRGFLDRCHNKF
jgi:hypothetical protein